MNMFYMIEFFATVSCTLAMYMYVRENTTLLVACPIKPVNVWSRYCIKQTLAYIINGKINPGLSVSSRLGTNYNGDLIIHDFKNADVGKYRCSSTNDTSPIWFDITVRLKYKPAFSKRKVNYLIYCDIGETVNISFQVYAYPTPNVLWTTSDCGGILREWNVTHDLDEPYKNTITSSVYVADISQLGKYVARVRNSEGSVHLNIRFAVKSAPIVKKQDVLITDLEVTMLVYFLTNLNDVEILWHVNDKNMQLSNISFTTKVNVSAFSSPNCGKLSHTSGRISKIQIIRKYISDIKTVTCELRSNFGSRESSFDLKWINSLIQDFDSKQIQSTTNVIWNVTAERQTSTASLSTKYHTAITTRLRNSSENPESDVAQSDIFHVPAQTLMSVACVVIGIGLFVVSFVVCKIRQGLKTGSVQIENANRQHISAQEVIEDPDQVSAHSEYAEIDSVSYNSVTWRNYSVEGDQEISCFSTSEHSSCRSMQNYENIIVYEPLQSITVDDSHSYEKCKSFSE